MRTLIAAAWRHATRLVLLALLAQVSHAPRAEAGETFFLVTLAGTPAGLASERTEPEGPGGFETHATFELVFNRLGARLEIATSETDHEDAAGHLLGVEARIRASAEETTLSATVLPGRIAITTTAGGRSYSRELEEHRPLLGAEGLRRATLAWLQDPAAPLEYAAFSTETGDVATVHRRWLARETRDGTEVAVIEEQVEGVPGRSRLVLDRDARTLVEQQDSPFGPIRIERSDEATARARLAGAPQPERYARSMLASNVRLPDPRSLARLRLRVVLDDSGDGWPELDGPGQRVIGRTARERRLEVTRTAPSADSPPEASPDDPDLAANVLLQADDPAVRAIADSLRRPHAGAFTLALAARDWVSGHLAIDSGLAVVPAGEAARNRRGTCVAFAVLTASIARALGIPARVVLGYAYVEGAFGGHAWTEVRIGSEWVAIDAALPGAGSADAARLAIVRHGGEAGLGTGALELTRLVGHVTLHVEAFARRPADPWTIAPATPWTRHGRHYANPGLGLALDAPLGFEFTGLDAHYPDPSLLALEGPRGERITFEERPLLPGDPGADEALVAAGYSGEAPAVAPGAPGLVCRRASATREACARRDGLTLWWLSADGASAVRALPTVLAGLRLGSPP
jgi:transglutaminase-like putative cysteine protease